MGLGLCGQLPSPVWMSPTLVSRWRRTDAPWPTVDGQGQHALEYLRDGTIAALGIQDCYKMGFDSIQVALMIADGLEPGDDTFPEQLAEETTICYPKDAQAIIDFLYPGQSSS